jgi:ARG/rhodanese/phosphatase superfamily protein
MPTLTDVEPLAQALRDLTTGAPLAHGALTVIPLLAPGAPDPGWLTLAEAGQAVTIEEVSEAGAVPTLRLTSTTVRPVLLLDGEELIGAKQNRVLNTTVLVAAGARLTIPVSCVEQGRWAYASRRFAAGDSTLYASLRAQKAAQVTQSLRMKGKHASDQGDIWARLSMKAADQEVDSPTGAMSDFYARHAQQMDAARAALAPRPGQVGALVFLGKRWLGLDLLPSPGLFERAWPRLCAGYAAEVLGRRRHASAPDPRAVLEKVAQAPVEEASAVGLGREHRLAGHALAGAALVVEDTVAHLMAFPAEA